MPLITSSHFYIFHSSTSYPSHSPHHRPIPRSRTIFPPDPDVKQLSPTKGTKNTTDPTAKRDRKPEFSAPVAKDPLTAEPLRAGGDFSRANPVSIIGVTADSSTTNTTGEKVREVQGSKPDGERYDEARVDPEKFVEVGASERGNRETGSFAIDSEGRPIREVLGGNAGGSAGRSSQATHNGSDVSRESTGDDGGRHGGSRGGLERGGGSKQPAGQGPTGDVNRVVPNTALDEQVNEPGLDWSKIPKDTKPVTDIGGGDLGRVAGHHLVKQVATEEQALGDTGGGIGRTIGEEPIFDYLKSSENA